jgi:hypothetical protein
MMNFSYAFISFKFIFSFAISLSFICKKLNANFFFFLLQMVLFKISKFYCFLILLFSICSLFSIFLFLDLQMYQEGCLWSEFLQFSYIYELVSNGVSVLNACIKKAVNNYLRKDTKLMQTLMYLITSPSHQVI